MEKGLDGVKSIYCTNFVNKTIKDTLFIITYMHVYNQQHALLRFNTYLQKLCSRLSSREMHF